MKQVVQNRKTGELSVEDIPSPALRPNGLLVKNVCSLISAGTGRTSVDLGKKNPVGKAGRERYLQKYIFKEWEDSMVRAILQTIFPTSNSYVTR